MVDSYNGQCVEIAQGVFPCLVTYSSMGVIPCGSNMNQQWRMNAFGQIMSQYDTTLCMEAKDDGRVMATPCSQMLPSQIWMSQGLFLFLISFFCKNDHMIFKPKCYSISRLFFDVDSQDGARAANSQSACKSFLLPVAALRA
jgi:hypothetical protein